MAGERERHHRNYAWETDHVEASVKVRIEGHIRKPWITFFIDCATSAICGLAISPQRPAAKASSSPSATPSLSTNTTARSAASPGTCASTAAENSCAPRSRKHSASWDPKSSPCPLRPRRQRQRRSSQRSHQEDPVRRHARLHPRPTLRGGKPVDPTNHCSTSKRSSTGSSNGSTTGTTRTPKSLEGRTPREAWDADPALIDTVTAEDLHTYTLERHGKPLTINNGGVRWRKRNYIADWMHGRVGEKVHLRYLPHHDHRVELYDPPTGRHLGAAVMAQQATREQALSLKQARRREADRLRAQLKKAEKNRNERFAAATRPAPPVPLDVMPEEEALEHLRALDGFDPAAEALPDLIQLPEPDAEWTLPLDPNTAPSHQPPTHPKDQP
ncbi:Mu transposase C-terminal domain-containing protein [Streptomyces sp. INA 01156]